MKKIICMLLSAIMLISLCSCGKKPESNNGTSDDQSVLNNTDSKDYSDILNETPEERQKAYENRQPPDIYANGPMNSVFDTEIETQDIEEPNSNIKTETQEKQGYDYNIASNNYIKIGVPNEIKDLIKVDVLDRLPYDNYFVVGFYEKESAETDLGGHVFSIEISPTSEVENLPAYYKVGEVYIENYGFMDVSVILPTDVQFDDTTFESYNKIQTNIDNITSTICSNSDKVEYKAIG